MIIQIHLINHCNLSALYIISSHALFSPWLIPILSIVITRFWWLHCSNLAWNSWETASNWKGFTASPMEIPSLHRGSKFQFQLMRPVWNVIKMWIWYMKSGKKPVKLIQIPFRSGMPLVIAYLIYPLVNCCNIAIENGHGNCVSFPINSRVDLSIVT